MKISEILRLNLSCYCCGGIDFKNTPREWNEVESMYFLNAEDDQQVKCIKCGLESYILNLVPRGFVHEDLVKD